MAYGSTVIHGDTGSLNPSSVEAPLSIGDSHGHEREALEALSLPDGATVRPEPTKRPQPTGKPAAASILTEGSLNDNRIKYTDMAQTKTIDLHVRLTYVVDEGREMVEEAEWENAISLAISPNFHTKEEGVSLERVIVEYPNGAERTYIEQTGSHGVFPIVNGCSTEGVFFGNLEECSKYAKEHYKAGDCIISPID